MNAEQRVIEKTHRIASAIEACPLARQARQRAFEAIQAGDYDGTMRYAGEAAAALLEANPDIASSVDIGLVLGAQVFAMTEEPALHN